MNTFFKNKLLLTLSVALVLSTSIASESRAVTCKFKTDPNNEGKYTLYVEGDAGGSEFTGSSCTNIPDGQSWGNIKPKITSASFDSNVTSIGNNAFNYAYSLQSVDLSNVTSLGGYAFDSATSLQSVDLSNITSIGNGAFSGATSLTNIVIPDDVNVDNWSASAFLRLASGAKITCWGDENTCYQKLGKFFTSSDCPNVPNITCNCSFDCIDTSKVQFPNTEQCNESDNYYYNTSANNGNGGCRKLPDSQETCTTAGFSWVSDKCTKTAPASQQQEQQGQGGQEQGQQGTQGSGQATSAADCAASGKYWQEGKCVSSCSASFKFNDGWCDRQRYTPAEAAKVLTDDNNNSVTITFKK